MLKNFLFLDATHLNKTQAVNTWVAGLSLKVLNANKKVSIQDKYNLYEQFKRIIIVHKRGTMEV